MKKQVIKFKDGKEKKEWAECHSLRLEPASKTIDLNTHKYL